MIKFFDKIFKMKKRRPEIFVYIENTIIYQGSLQQLLQT